MEPREGRPAATKPRRGAELPVLVRAGIDTLEFGFAIFDDKLTLVLSNRALRSLRGYPAALCEPRTELVENGRTDAIRVLQDAAARLSAPGAEDPPT